EAAVVVHPATYHGIDKLREAPQSLVVSSGAQAPSPNGGPNRGRGLRTDGREEANEAFPPAILGQTRLEGVPQEVERHVRIVTGSAISFAVDNPSLHGMKLQTALRKASPDSLQHLPSL